MVWREYHDLTKHSAESLRRAQHVLDWENMPDPFRHYEGVPVLDLPADPPVPGIPALDVLRGAYGHTSASNGPALLSQLLFYSAAISASKRVPSTGDKYALRVNPSSGNLHPTEFHFLTRGLKGWPDGLYHYRPSSHMAEQRALGQIDFQSGEATDPIEFVLTSIAWREAWKYRERAYRYCLLDAGHAWQSLALSARAMGCESFAMGHFPDDDVSHALRLNGDEWPMLLVRLRGRPLPLREPDTEEMVWYGGQANLLSERQVKYSLLDRIHSATKIEKIAVGSVSAEPARAGSGALHLPPPAPSTRSFGEAARMRRSALDFRGGARSIPLAELSAILDSAAQPFAADFSSAPLIQLYLYVHRVESVAPGVYRHWPDSGGLEQIQSGDQRVAAAGLSLHQDLAGNACVAFSMIADLDRAARAHGERGYRYAYFEAGAIGQRMYLAAEALGLGATGIGAFFDDRVHEYLNLAPGEGEDVYHFAIGYPVVDSRLEAG